MAKYEPKYCGDELVKALKHFGYKFNTFNDKWEHKVDDRFVTDEFVEVITLDVLDKLYEDDLIDKKVIDYVHKLFESEEDHKGMIQNYNGEWVLGIL